MNDILRKNISDLEKQIELTATQRKMITETGDIYRYIDGEIIDIFNIGDIADISFPNGYGHGCRVHKGICPTLCCATVKSLIVKVGYDCKCKASY